MTIQEAIKSMMSPGGYVCANCGAFVMYEQPHDCISQKLQYFYPLNPCGCSLLLLILERIAKALEKLAEVRKIKED